MRNKFSLESMRNSYGNHVWELIWGYANFFTHGAEWELMPRRTHMRTWETHFFMRSYENSHGNHSWEIRFGHANFFTHGAEWELMPRRTHMRTWETHFFTRRYESSYGNHSWEIMPRRIHMRTRENDFSWEGVRNHAPVGIFLSFLKWWHFSKFKNCCLIIFF